MKNSGFTLIELLIVIAVAAILVAVAVPSYQASIRKSRRSEAQTTLMNFAGLAERVYTQSTPNSYIGVTLPAATDYYTYSFPVAVTATTYTILATPKTIQSQDSCKKMSLTQAGQKTNTGTSVCRWK